ncbi:MAG TPA: glycosyltransferase family 87 protein [Thermoanaerobaculia bacterium]|nr:glycosyltransferase family 87 protein [Thermoanaerobaculia bacterium]
MNSSVTARVPITIAFTAALLRLIPLHWLHPLNWDELEFYQATAWIAQGRVPFRDFWEHHSPLAWFLFAPFTLLSNSPGVDAIVMMRWAQVPVWIATFWLLHVWMRNAGIGAFARWSAVALAVCSSLFMTAAVEYRVEAVGCALLMAGLVLAQRERWFFSGVAFCLAGFTNLRLGPVLVIAVLSLLVMRRLRSWPIVVGGFSALAACLAYFAATGSLMALYQNLWVDNLAEKFAAPIIGSFIHRLLVPFGVRIMASDRLFELAAVDVGGVFVLLVGFAGMFYAWRKRGDVLLVAILQLVNLLFISMMKFIYNYHLALAVVLFVPLIAIVIERIPRRNVVIAILVAAWCVNAFASIFRGKELDRAYQDRIMREVHARTRPGDEVWGGVSWALRREPAYRFWFLPELARQLVTQGLAPKWAMQDPPAVVVLDYNALRWLGSVQRELAPYFARHYIPVWRDLWVPAMNSGLPPGATRQWIVPRDGAYRVYVSRGLARHPWFRTPWMVAAYKRDDASRFTVTLPEPGAGPVQFDRDVTRLRKGDRITAFNPSGDEVAVILLSTDDRVLFRQPPPGVTLEGETTRITHVPNFRARIEP